MLEVKSKEKTSPISFTLTPSQVDVLDQLAKIYNSNRSQIVAAMITQYGTKVLNQNKQDAES